MQASILAEVENGELDDVSEWDLLTPLLSKLNQCSYQKERWCYVHEKFCPSCPPRRGQESHDGDMDDMLWVEIAGTPCVAWSTMRRKAQTCTGRWLHPTTLPTLVWLSWCKHCQPDILLHECTPLFDIKTVRDYILTGWSLHSFVFTPQALGLPAKRLRGPLSFQAL